MIEELYIQANGASLQLDLPSPSGIVLTYKSNIFGDITKIEASHSYTFKLPHTANNRRVFGLADDIRSASDLFRHKYKAEYKVNGIDILGPAFLYLSDVTSNDYNAVLTWGVIEGFNTLKNSDVSLNELPTDGETSLNKPNQYPPVTQAMAYSNDDRYVNVSFESDYDGNMYPLTSNALPPCIPIYRLVELINKAFDVHFDFGQSFRGSNSLKPDATFDYNDTHPLIATGAVSLVNTQTPDYLAEMTKGWLDSFRIIDAKSEFFGEVKTNHIVSFILGQGIGNVYQIGTHRGFPFSFSKSNPKAQIDTVEIDGFLRVTFSGVRYVSIIGAKRPLDDTTDVKPKLIVYRRKLQKKSHYSDIYDVVVEEAATVEGKLSGQKLISTINLGRVIVYYTFDFDFREANAKQPLLLDDFNTSTADYPYFFAFSEDVYCLEEASVLTIKPKGNFTLNALDGMPISLVENLPQISCMDFMKSIYYAMGAFPVISKDGRIRPLTYNSLYDNISKGNFYNWSAKATDIYNSPQQIKHTLSSFGPSNYLLMKNDSLEDSTGEKGNGEDGYSNGELILLQNGNTEKDDVTIFQFPFYADFIRDKDRPLSNVKYPLKYYKYDDNDNVEYNEAMPAILMLNPRQCHRRGEDGKDVSDILMVAEVWTAKKHGSLSYSSLRTILANPTTIKDTLRLNEFDLRDIDYSKPVYLEKYNSFFAIQSIQRGNDGKCTCELIKLP